MVLLGGRSLPQTAIIEATQGEKREKMGEVSNQEGEGLKMLVAISDPRFASRCYYEGEAMTRIFRPSLF